jgi:hypothetical protein
MTVEWHEIQQFEYRWQPAKDLSLIAGSCPAAAIRPWSDRIALWVRHRAVEDPAQSVRYEMFNDGMAALAWRQRNAEPFGSENGAEGRPEVSRVLVGAVRILTPEVAVAICHTGLPDAIGPRPGEVAIGSLLPVIEPAGLTGLVRDQADELDRLAMNETGLYRVIAAALTDLDTALSVQLPERLIAMSPQDGSQGPLLWGLRRTVWPLLGPDGGRRSWSFSTYEPPLGDVDTGALADIVFRAQKAAQLALSMRREILVRPQEPIEPPATILYQEFAGLLVDAYQDLGGEELGRRLGAAGGGYRSVNERIEDARVILGASRPTAAAPVPGDRSVRPAVPPWTQQERIAPAEDSIAAQNVASAGAFDSLEDVTSPETNIPSASSAPPASSILPVSPADPKPPATPPPWAPQVPAVSFSAPPQPAPPLRTARNRQEPYGAILPYGVSRLLDQLHAGPTDPEFESALRLLRTGRFPDQPADRAAARRRIAERDWYIPVLLQYDSAHFDDTLEAIFRVAVVPDLGRPGVTEELARWAGERPAPPPVIKALYAATQGRAGASEALGAALELPLGRRWLAEHGIYSGPSAYAAAAVGGQGSGVASDRGSHAASGSYPRRTSSDARRHRDPVTLLTLFCAVLIALLVLSLVY